MAAPKPYIGVTGFVTLEEVHAALDHVPERASRYLMVGVLASYKSLRREPMREKWAKQTPDIEILSGVFPDYYTGKETLHLVHYTGDDETLCQDLVEIVRRVQYRLDGFQLNLVWPAPAALERFHELTRLSRRRLVLQVSRQATAAFDDDTTLVAQKLRDYHDLVDYVLLDASGGEGRLLDLEWARRYLHSFEDRNLPFRLGVAGGLGVRSMEQIQRLLVEFPYLSWDAQGRLRNQRNELDLEAVGSYLDQSFALVQK